MTTATRDVADLWETVLRCPRDLMARRAWADSLSEAGDVRGEFAAVQLELAAPCEISISCGRLVNEPTALCEFHSRLRCRERELLEQNWFQWAEVEVGRKCELILIHLIEDGNELAPGHAEVWFRHGAAEHVRLPLAAWIGRECERCENGTDIDGNDCPDCYGNLRIDALGPNIVRVTPLVSVEFSDRESTTGLFDACDHVLTCSSRSHYPVEFSHGPLDVDGLSQAAIRWARRKAKPALPEEF